MYSFNSKTLMGNSISCVCSHPAETKFQVEAAQRERIQLKAIEASKSTNLRKKKKNKQKLQELQPELIFPSLARKYLTKRYFIAAKTLRKFSNFHKLTYAPIPTRPEIEEIEKSLSPFSVKKITSPNLKFIPTVELYTGGYYEGQ